MFDYSKRKIDYVRISVTDKCNLRCVYCIPDEGVEQLHSQDILTDEEIIRLCQAFITLGINNIKITGGEPLLRKDVAGLIEQIKRLQGIQRVTLTTNGVKLKEYLPDLIKAGLDGINISLDTLNGEIYRKITSKDALEKVLESVEQALAYEHLNVKINCVPSELTDSCDIIDMAALAKDSRLNVRFIEMMPIGPGKNFTNWSEDKIIKLLEKTYGTLELTETVYGNGPAHYYSIKGFKGKIGFISALSHQFCESCNRVRVTSDGCLKTCLYYAENLDLKNILRKSNGNMALEQAIWQNIYDKPAGHKFKSDNEDGKIGQVTMSQIGG